MRIAKFSFITFIILMVTTNPALAVESYCSSKNLGWHFYCDSEMKRSEEGNAKTYQSATAAISDIREELEESKAKAVLKPTEENVKNYIVLQNLQVQRAERFSKVWSKVLWKYPALDFSVNSPNSTVGNEVTAAAKEEAIQASLHKLGSRYGIFFFYSTSCPYCHKYSPILKAFAKTYGLNVMAVSRDGKILHDWPESEVDKGQIAAMGLANTPLPATVLFDNKTQSIIPVGFGILAMSELRERIYQLTREDKDE